MLTSNTGARPQARLPKGLRDIEAAELRERDGLLSKIRKVYESYGFDPLETPAFEYTDALGKFLPDQDRPNEGVFSFTDEDGAWLSLRYDLTAPLARYVAENFQRLPKPFRRYAVGSVWRNEKPGPGRFREFVQFDADTVGAESVAADAEMCMLAADALEALGIERGDYVIKVSNRKVLDGLRETIGLSSPEYDGRWLTAMRALDKLDRLGMEAVKELLSTGRKDESGDVTPGAGLEAEKIEKLLWFACAEWKIWQPVNQLRGGTSGWVDEDQMIRTTGAVPEAQDIDLMLKVWADELSSSRIGSEGIAELLEMNRQWRAAGYGTRRIEINASVVRGLEYYTGPVFEAELTFDVKNTDGQPVRFGSAGGGGRYDDLVARFTGERVPATGFSIGVSRLQAALAALGRTETANGAGPVVVLVMDRDELPRYQRMTQELRSAGIRAEMYLGASGMKAQMKYADKRGSPCVVIQGSSEREAGEVQVKDLVLGAKAAAGITDNKEWKSARPAQVSVPEDQMIETVRAIVARHASR